MPRGKNGGKPYSLKGMKMKMGKKSKKK